MDDLHEDRRQKNGRSLFGPIFLIGLGVYFLLRNMGIVSELNWAVALQLWPLLLIFIGINIIVQQVRRPFGTALSGLVGLTAVALFGAVRRRVCCSQSCKAASAGKLFSARRR